VLIVLVLFVGGHIGCAVASKSSGRIPESRQASPDIGSTRVSQSVEATGSQRGLININKTGAASSSTNWLAIVLSACVAALLADYLWHKRLACSGIPTYTSRITTRLLSPLRKKPNGRLPPT